MPGILLIARHGPHVPTGSAGRGGASRAVMGFGNDRERAIEPAIAAIADQLN